MAIQSLNFKSPFCNHTILASEIAMRDYVSCECGRSYSTATIEAFLAQKAATDAAYFAFDAQRKKYDVIYEQLKAEYEGQAAARTVAQMASSPAAAAPAATPVFVPAVELPAREPVVLTPLTPKAVKPRRPKSPPLSPRTILLMVAALMVLVSVSIFEVNYKNFELGVAFVLVLVLAFGFGAVKLHKTQRNIGNFFAVLSGSLLYFGALALGALWHPLCHGWVNKICVLNENDVSHYLYLPVFFLIITAILSTTGRIFKIFGWALFGPLGLAVITVLLSLGYIPNHVANAADVTWSVLVASAGGLAIGAVAKIAKFTVPTFDVPEDELSDVQKFEIEDATKERAFTRQLVNLGLIVALGIITVQYGRLPFMALIGLSSQNPGLKLSYMGMLSLGALWTAAAMGLEKIGSRFTDSGTVHPAIIRGAWILGLTNLAAMATSLIVSADPTGSANIVAAFGATAVAAVALLLPKWVAVLRNSPAAKLATEVAAWSAWLGWWLGTAHPVAFDQSHFQALSVLLFLISATWFAVRLVFRSQRYQYEAYLPAAIGAVILGPVWVYNGGAAHSQTLAGGATSLALIMVLGSAILAGLGFINSWVTKRSGVETAGGVLISGVLANIALALTSLQVASTFNAGGTDASIALIPLLIAAFALGVLRLAYLGSKAAGRNPELTQTAAVTAALNLALPLVFAIWFASFEHRSDALFAVLFAVELLVTAGYAVWVRNSRYALAAIALGLALTLNLDYLLATGFAGIGKGFAAGIAVFWLLQIALLAAFAKRLPDSAALLAKLGPVLFVVSTIGHLAFFAAHNAGQPLSSALAWQDTVAFLLVAAATLWASNSSRFSAIESLPQSLTRSGLLALVFAVADSLSTAGTAGTSLRLLVALVATAGILLVTRSSRADALKGGFEQAAIFATRFALVAAVILVSQAVDASQPVTAVLVGFAAIAVWLSLDALFAGAFAIATQRFASNAALVIYALVLNPALLPQLAGIDGAYRILDLSLPPAHTAANISLALAAVLSAAALYRGIREWKQVAAGEDVEAGTGANVALAEPIIIWAFGATAAFELFLTPAHLFGTANWLALLALLFGYHSFAAKQRVSAYGAYFAGVTAGWLYAAWLLLTFNLPFLQPINLAGIAGFSLGAWLLSRVNRELLTPFAKFLPATIAVSYLIGLDYLNSISYQTANGPFTHQTGVYVDLAALLALVAGYAWFANGSLAKSVPNMPRSLFASAGLSWLAGLLLVVIHLQGHIATASAAYLAASGGIAVWYSLRYRSAYGAYLAFAALAASGSIYSAWLTHKLQLSTVLLVALVGVAAYVIGAWLLKRIDQNLLGQFAVALPVAVGVSYLIGFGVATARTAADWLVLLAANAAYLWFSQRESAKATQAVNLSYLATAGLTWAAALWAALTQSGVQHPAATTTEFFALTSVIAVWFALAYGSRTAVYGIYASGLVTAIALQSWLAQPGPEVFAFTAAGYAVLGTWVHERKVEKFKGTMVRWAVPLGLVLVTLAAYSVSYSNLPFSHQTALEAGRFIAVSLVSTAGVLLGIRFGNRGITTASTTALMVALVPGLWFRIDEISDSVTVRNETKALLVAVTVYVLTYIFRKNSHVSLPSFVVWGVPALISLSISFTDSMVAVGHGQITAEDWIRFGVVMSAGTAFLTIGAIRRIAGLFYPGLLTVVVTVLPYSWKAGGLFWAVLLILAALIVWVAIKLDRFTGWLKALE